MSKEFFPNLSLEMAFGSFHILHLALMCTFYLVILSGLFRAFRVIFTRKKPPSRNSFQESGSIRSQINYAVFFVKQLIFPRLHPKVALLDLCYDSLGGIGPDDLIAHRHLKCRVKYGVDPVKCPGLDASFLQQIVVKLLYIRVVDLTNLLLSKSFSYLMVEVVLIVESGCGLYIILPVDEPVIHII